MKPITGLHIRLGLDITCWVGATIALLWFQYPTIAALVGAFGIVYLYRMFQRYRQYVVAIRMQEEMTAALMHFLNTGEQPDDPNISIRRFDSEQDFIDQLNKEREEHDEEQWPNP